MLLHVIHQLSLWPAFTMIYTANGKVSIPFTSRTLARTISSLCHIFLTLSQGILGHFHGRRCWWAVWGRGFGAEHFCVSFSDSGTLLHSGSQVHLYVPSMQRSRLIKCRCRQGFHPPFHPQPLNPPLTHGENKRQVNQSLNVYLVLTFSQHEAYTRVYRLLVIKYIDRTSSV